MLYVKLKKVHSFYSKYLLHNNSLEMYLFRFTRYQDQPGFTNSSKGLTVQISIRINSLVIEGHTGN